MLTFQLSVKHSRFIRLTVGKIQNEKNIYLTCLEWRCINRTTHTTESFRYNSGATGKT